MYGRDPDTGYYETEEGYMAEDRRLEAEERDREDRFEAKAEEMLANQWAGTDYRALAIGMIYASHDIGMVPIPEKKEAA